MTPPQSGAGRTAEEMAHQIARRLAGRGLTNSEVEMIAVSHHAYAAQVLESLTNYSSAQQLASEIWDALARERAAAQETK